MKSALLILVFLPAVLLQLTDIIKAKKRSVWDDTVLQIQIDKKPAPVDTDPKQPINNIDKKDKTSEVIKIKPDDVTPPKNNEKSKESSPIIDPLNVPCFRVGSSYIVDADKEDGTEESSKDCQKKCQLEPNCNFFSYNTKTKKCYIKHDVTEPVDDTDVTSGPKKCACPPESRIVGGNFVQDIKERPWQVLIFFYNDPEKRKYYRCGGSLIRSKDATSSTHVVTAAHCLYNKATKDWYSKDSIIVYHSTLMLDGLSKASEVSGTKGHPKYIYSEGGKPSGNDIAILTLKTPIPWSDSAQYISYEESQNLDGASAIASGWGSSKRDAKFDCGVKQLKKIDLKILPHNECKAYEYLPDILCAQPLYKPDDLIRGGTFHGDSGGPLDVEVENKKVRYLAGVTSFTPTTRNENNDNIFKFDVYTKVYYHEEFINNFVNPIQVPPPVLKPPPNS